MGKISFNFLDDDENDDLPFAAPLAEEECDGEPICSDVYKCGNLRGQVCYCEVCGKIGISIWYPHGLDADGEEMPGLCFDLDFADIDDMIELLEELQDVESLFPMG